ncbi:RIP metalloprotease RseP [Lysobacter solisilvae (ex Woo and Kim 2020)]|uniref:Zinc metalloprotease n=1 Tax=Agrilutibacter terrestris TaxID=2865112 RepID=A0A7H0FW39_9GAMM|nr:RIP metalloprotease RseP [Lysobacter terrestris]QNP40255.1 RIP metalloprotease RseP [Lysobacter terrestris]
MSEFIGSVWWLLVSLGVLITIHEFGHYWVARRCGVKVLRFSIGFGKPLWLHRGKDGTEFAIAAIPLGGYVKMLGEHSLEGQDAARAVSPEELAQSHDRQPVWKRMAISFAGPAANLILCVVLLWGMFVIGRPDFAPVVGQAQGVSAAAGLQRGDEVLAVAGRTTPTWSEVSMGLLTAALDRKDTAVRVREQNGGERTLTLPLSRLPADFDETRALQQLGLRGRHEVVAPVVGRVIPNQPAWGVLAEGDRITAIDGEPTLSYEDIVRITNRLGEENREAMIEVQRDEDRLALPLKPARQTRDGKTYWGFGLELVSQEPRKDAVLRYGPIAAVPAAVSEAVHQSRELFATFGRAFKGTVSTRNTVAGPITIARASNYFAQQGPAHFLMLLALLSLSLGILNLLPIPILDGGHLLYYLIELVKGSPVSERVMAAGNFVGLALIAGLMGLAFYNDIVNNLVR